jgi:hypothetical protein
VSSAAELEQILTAVPAGGYLQVHQARHAPPSLRGLHEELMRMTVAVDEERWVIGLHEARGHCLEPWFHGSDDGVGPG